MRFSRLRKLVEDLWDPELDMSLHCTAYRRSGASEVGVYWIDMGKERLWQAPADLEMVLKSKIDNSEAPRVTAILREYLETPKDDLITFQPAGDIWGLADLLRIADRRIGKRRLEKFDPRDLGPAAQKILDARLGRSN